MNYFIFKLINGLAGKWSILDHAMLMLSKTAIIIVVGLLIYNWFQRNENRKYTAYYIVLTLILAFGSNFILHIFYYHARPFVSHQVTKLIAHSSDSSFVSDHGTLVFSVAIILLMRKEKVAKSVLIWACLVGISRVYVGVHYPFDILGSVVLSFVAGGAVLKSRKYTDPLMKIVLERYYILMKNVPFLNKKNTNLSNKICKYEEN